MVLTNGRVWVRLRVWQGGGVNDSDEYVAEKGDAKDFALWKVSDTSTKRPPICSTPSSQ